MPTMTIDHTIDWDRIIDEELLRRLREADEELSQETTTLPFCGWDPHDCL